MEKKVIPVIAAALICACEDVEYIPGDYPGTEPITKVEPLYSAALAYPEGYDWRRDSLGESAPAEIILFKDGVRILQVDAVPENDIGAESSSHRIIGGHLYTDCISDDGHTVLKKDGLEFLRLDAEEIIRSLILADSCAYTLGIPKGGTGWTLRRNGEVLNSSPEGKLLGELHRDGDSLYFGAAVPIEGVGAASAAGWHYYLVANGRPRLLRCDDDTADILAVRSCKGQLNWLACMKNGSLMWKSPDSEVILNREGSIPWRNAYFVTAADTLYAHVQQKLRPKSWTDMFFRKNGSTSYSHEGCEVYALCRDRPCLCFASTPSGKTSPVTVQMNGEKHTFPPEFCMISPYAIATDGKKYALGLNDSSDNYRPILVRGQDTSRFDFNGYFTRLYLP